MSFRIPLNIITGFLGVGKTTAVLNLLKHKPANERWAVLVNEFGKVAIDNITLESDNIDGVDIKEVAGGCLCCTANTPFQAALATIIFKIKPQRIIVEPSGLGFLSALNEALQSERVRNMLDIRATICLVDANQLNDLRIQNNEIYKAQLKASDVVLINKTDITTTIIIDKFTWWMTENIGPKQYIGKTSNGLIELDLLNLYPATSLNEPEKPFVHFIKDKKLTLATIEAALNGIGPEPRKPLCIPNQVEGYKAFGLIFSANDIFNKLTLYEVLSKISVLRLKGIFKTDIGYFIFNRVNDYFSAMPVSASNDSRMEIIVFMDDTIDFDAVAESIINCIS